MVETHDHFTKRLNLLGQKHAQLTHGYSTKVQKDGLIVVSAKRRRRSLPLAPLLMVLVGFFALKAFMLATVGPVTYNERLSSLKSGSFVERAGAFLMEIDPITNGLASLTGPVMR